MSIKCKIFIKNHYVLAFSGIPECVTNVTMMLVHQDEMLRSVTHYKQSCCCCCVSEDSFIFRSSSFLFIVFRLSHPKSP